VYILKRKGVRNMALELKAVKGTNGRPDIGLTRFSGGIERGAMLQLTRGAPIPGVVSLTKAEAAELAVALVQFVAGTVELA
jgi:hypothetical protein